MRVIYEGILKCKPLHEAVIMCLEETQSVPKLWLILCALDVREGHTVSLPTKWRETADCVLPLHPYFLSLTNLKTQKEQLSCMFFVT